MKRIILVIAAVVATSFAAGPATASTAGVECALVSGGPSVHGCFRPRVATHHKVESFAEASLNVVPNPGFEQAGCGNTPDVCSWLGAPSISQDTTDPHSGTASMHADCGLGGCFGDPWDTGTTGFGASSVVCAAIGPGLHPASFWYRDAAGSYQVDMQASFYPNADCTGSVAFTSLTDSVDETSGWHQVAGAVLAPPGTQSVHLEIFASAFCDGYCYLSANFDDLDLEDSSLTTPYIISFADTAGVVGDSVDIHGANLTGATSVTFNGAAASFTVDSDSEIHATVPSGATTGPISVATPGGTTTSLAGYTVLPPPPTVGSFTPTSGPIGTTVDISGSNFTGAYEVQFTNAEATDFVVDSDSEIHATVPKDAVTGPITVTTGSGTGSSASPFTVPVPTINSFTPTSGPVGTSVDINGSNLTAVTSLEFNGSPDAQFTIDSDTEIHATVPCGAWPGPIVLGTASGDGRPSSSSSFTVTAPPPSISSFSPTSGPVDTGGPVPPVDIRGSNLCGAIPKFNGTVADGWTLGPSDSEVQAWVRAGSTTGPISVTTPGGTATSSDSFTVISPPSISSLTPGSGPIGTTVTITGTNLTGATGVSFGSAASFTVNSATSITATVPNGAATGPISVTTPGGIAVSPYSFVVTLPQPPTISSFTPSSGTAGTSVDIRGTDLTGTTSVEFNGAAAASFAINSSTDITARVPAAATTGPISITTPSGTATSSSSFTVTPPPGVSSFTPTSGPVGTQVDIQGSNLTGATSVAFNGSADPSFVVNSSTDITAHVPAGATSGPISVTTSAGTATSTVSFTVTLASAPPTISGFSPTSGHVGQQVTITGSSFTGATTVTLGTTSAKFTIDSPTQITATVPSIAHGLYKWSLTSPAGTATSNTTFHVR